MSSSNSVTVLGVFVADTTYRAERPPRMGETILGNSFALGPGGKGSNQSVAIGRLGTPVNFISRLGDDDFAAMATKIWSEAGVTPVVTRDPENYTGAAYIFVDEATGDNAIIICPGAAADISVADVEAQRHTIEGSAVFVTQLEQPLGAAHRALEIARKTGVKTILNPAPAAELSDDMLALCDFVTPNETETEELTGLNVSTIEEARQAADALLKRGPGAVILTLGEQGALYHTAETSELVPAINAGPVVETTGAGDAFNGGFASALASGKSELQAVRYGCAVAGLSVTRPGTAPSMPSASEVAELMNRQA
ncbi:MAG: ribokinase [Pseudomonadota bacterium]